MLPKWHILIGAVFALILFLFADINFFYSLLFFLSSFLIDADHYFYYIIEKRKFSLKKAYNWCIIEKAKMKALSTEERQKHAKYFFLFHGIEPLIILALLSSIYYPFFFIFLGSLIHLVVDLIEATALGLMRRKLSLIYALYTRFKK